jgi:hypothetical protein
VRAWQWIGAFIAVGFIAVSTVMAARFGYSLGASEVDRWLYAFAGGLADVLKAFLPLLIVLAWLSGQYARCFAGAVLFVVFTGYSVTSSFGLAAIQSADKLGEHAAASTTYKDLRSDLARLMDQRAKLDAEPVADNAEALAQTAVEQADASVSSECGKRGPECRRLESIARTKRDELAAIVAAMATAKAAADLDAKIEAARLALGKVDAGVADKDADPQSAAIAKATGKSQDSVRMVLHGLIAAVVELGSGLGLYVVFGHHGRPPEAMQQGNTPMVDAIAPPIGDVITIEGPSDAIGRFMLEKVRPVEGARVAASDLFAAYDSWSVEQGLSPVSVALFGRHANWRKDRVGGRVWYLDASLVASVSQRA